MAGANEMRTGAFAELAKVSAAISDAGRDFDRLKSMAKEAARSKAPAPLLTSLAESLDIADRNLRDLGAKQLPLQMQVMAAGIAELADAAKAAGEGARGAAAGAGRPGGLAAGASGLLATLAQGVAAVHAPIQALSGLGGRLAGFVQALNPAAAQVFGSSLRDLQAVIGLALTPVLAVLTQAVREVSSALYPVAERLAPALGELARAALEVAQPFVQVFAAGLRQAGPVLQMLAGAAQAVAAPLQAAGTVFAAMASATAELFGSATLTAMDAFRGAMQKLAVNAIAAAGALAKMAGNDALLRNLILAAKGGPRKSAEGLGAATGGQVTNVAAFQAAQDAAAYTASALGAAKKSEDWLKDAVKLLEEIQKGNLDARAWLEGQWENLALKVRDKLKNLPVQLVQAAFDAIREAAQNSPAANAAAIALVPGYAGAALARKFR